MLKEISSVFSFLTIIPSNNTNLETVAKYMHVFPIIGIAIGLLIGSMGFGLSFFLEPLIVSLLVVASIAIITGIHHTDGLADFADGLMTRGTKEQKRKAMKDLSTGSAGIVSVVLYRSEEHTSELQSLVNLVCRLLLEKKNKTKKNKTITQLK